MTLEALKSTSILYVEDDPMIVEFTAKILSKVGRSVYTALDGVEGLEVFTQHRPDIVVTDLEMPRMHGVEMIAKIRQIDPKVPIVIVTAFEDEAHEARVHTPYVLVKPIRREDMREMLLKAWEETRG